MVCEMYVKIGMVLVGGEVIIFVWVDIEEFIWKIVKEIGYMYLDMGFDVDLCVVLNVIGK